MLRGVWEAAHDAVKRPPIARRRDAGLYYLPLSSPIAKDALVAAARAATANAYAPYSQFLVGAAVLLDTGEVFTGCNVENASYGLTICAERNAIFAAVAAKGKIQIRAIAAVNSQATACSPCGACRQVIAECSRPETVVYYQSAKGVLETTIAELLPDSFTKQSLKQ
jgi:cytidine deaminase